MSKTAQMPTRGFEAARDEQQDPTTTTTTRMTPGAPCLLEFQLSAGQRLNVSLLDFASPPRHDVTGHVASAAA